MRRALLLGIGVMALLGGTATAASAAEPVLSAADVSVAEDASAGKAVVTLRLDRAAQRRTPIAWKTVNGSATGADYVPEKGTAVFRVGSRVRTISIPIKNDGLDEGAERFRVVFSGTRVRTPDKTAVVRITDDDPLPRLSAGTRTVPEGLRGTRSAAPVTLRLSARSGKRVKVIWAITSKTATAGTDVVGRGTAYIAAGKTSTTLPVQVVGDNVAEGDQVAVVTLKSPTNARVARHGRVTVDDDDDPASATDLEVRLATARAATKSFSAVAADGVTLAQGNLRAEAADGTIYELSLPQGALKAPTTITMTPWADVEGVSVSGGRLAGVDLKPNGLELLKGATLEITPPAGADVGALSFAYLGNGRQAHHYPLTLDPSKLEFTVSHFSGYGGYLGDNISIPVVPDPPGDPAQKLSAEIAFLVAEERQRQLEGEAPNPEVWETIQLYLTSYYDNVIAPMLPNIRSSCTYAKANNAQVLGWAHQTAIMFGGGEFGTQQQAIVDAVVTGAENCLNEALEPCVDPTDAGQTADINGAWRTVLLFGGTVPDPAPDDESRHCKTRLAGTVTVQYDSVILISGRFRHEEHYTLTFQPQLEQHGGSWYDDGRGTWSLTGTYEYDNLPANCDSYDTVYTGDGLLLPAGHLMSAQEGDGVFQVAGFSPAFDYGTITADGEAVGRSATTHTGYIDGGCGTFESGGAKWFGVPPCPTTSGPVTATRITDPVKGVGVRVDCTRSLNSTTTDREQTGSITVTGELWVVKS